MRPTDPRLDTPIPSPPNPPEIRWERLPARTQREVLQLLAQLLLQNHERSVAGESPGEGRDE
jgi:hypothetical protein